MYDMFTTQYAEDPNAAMLDFRTKMAMQQAADAATRYAAANPFPYAPQQYGLPSGIPQYQAFGSGSPSYGASPAQSNHWLNTMNALGRKVKTQQQGLLGNYQGGLLGGESK